ncbi:DUF6286 domain-containing protein [Streptomyces triticiradicis]|uniref:DUF6286 domain-containing protein n=1 Tax=Streptomyces triticiradicis TaxID=2651189 RepID=A0A7J5DGK3_9ACTN|nr:DUF6286 domain-containing protein [Streptomyces triticiradicis]KAB1987345.1 hypothetical protein F8144_18360 [Streptomyces triticiradicis]
MSEPQGSEDTRKTPLLEKRGGGDDAGALGQSASSAAYEPLDTAGDADGRQGRFWSARRVPAGVLAFLLVVVAGAFLYDVVAVRAGRSALRWRTWLAEQLAERPLDGTPVLAGAAVAAVVGLWLIVLAATPGLRDVLPMRRTHADVRAGLHRDAAALTLRDRAMEVAGVRSVRVRVKRRKVDVRAVAHFRELDDVRADLDATLADGIKGLGLSRQPALAVRVARPGRKG